MLISSHSIHVEPKFYTLAGWLTIFNRACTAIFQFNEQTHTNNGVTTVSNSNKTEAKLLREKRHKKLQFSYEDVQVILGQHSRVLAFEFEKTTLNTERQTHSQTFGTSKNFGAK